jgi:hypothetical protein
MRDRAPGQLSCFKPSAGRNLPVGSAANAPTDEISLDFVVMAVRKIEPMAALDMGVHLSDQTSGVRIGPEYNRADRLITTATLAPLTKNGHPTWRSQPCNFVTVDEAARP